RYPMGEGSGAHPLVGGWLPDLVLHTADGPVRVAELTRTGRPLLIDLTEDAAPADAVAPWRDRIDVVCARGADPEGATALLVRPDGHVAWAGDHAPVSAGDLAELRAAACRWFGEVQWSRADPAGVDAGR